jgi:hypothetical protein
LNPMSRSGFGGPAWDISLIQPPWENRPSIYHHIVANRGDVDLPDEARLRETAGFGYVSGAFDGSVIHHGGGGSADDIAEEVFGALHGLMREPTDDRARVLYHSITEHHALDFLDSLLERVVEDETIDADRLHAVAHWLATQAADREAVKVAIAILGIFTGDQDRDLFLAVGQHEEFTLYAAVALLHTGAGSERDLWQLGTRVTGWGRIHIIERLADTEDQHIKAWLLREGSHNTVMDEYTALICAQAGGLLDALRLPDPDDALLSGAGRILSALIAGREGPGAGLENYPPGAEAAELYLRHLQHRDPGLEHFVVVGDISSFLDEAAGEVQDEKLGWPQRRPALLQLANRILMGSDWEELVWKGLSGDDQDLFFTATRAARALGLDTWEVHFARLQRGEDDWFNVVQTDDPLRVERVIALAEQRLDLQAIATGPAEQLGLGPGFRHHTALDFVLQGLAGLPGKGWPLIRAGLHSPVMRNRNMAIRALAAWDRDVWPAEARALIQQAAAEEPNDDTRELLTRVIEGEAI